MKRYAELLWSGTGKEGKGHFITESKALNNTLFNYSSRFESGEGTNSEELLAAAHAGCFTMKIAFFVNAKGFTAEKLDTKCIITMDNGVISASHLILKAIVPGISQEDFDAIVQECKEKCMVSQLFNFVTTCESVLEG